MKETIVFSHANGFPAGTYRLLFDAWRAAGCEVLAIDKYGHDPDYPVSNNWPRLRDQLVHFVEPLQRPVHLVGHSLGGMVSLLAACRRPALAKNLVLLDSPVVAGWRAHSLHAIKLSGLIRRGGPGKVSARRRWQWEDGAAAHAHFAGKSVFARWQPEVLRDYIASGIEPDDEGGGVRLAFRREVETRIYNTLPHDLARTLRRHPPRCPVAYVGGTRSHEGRQAGLSATRALVGDRLRWVEGTHLFPMEKPAETAAVVLDLLGLGPRA